MTTSTKSSRRNRSRDANPLARRHFSRVVKRPYHRARKLFPSWGLTWNLKGKRVLPLGTASAMSQVSFDNDGRENIELTCVVAQLDPKTGEIAYSDVKMSHAFHRNPYAGARGRLLDPRFSNEPGIKHGDRPNGDWVSLALDMDALRVRVAEQNWKLDVEPALPEFQLGYESMDAINFEVTQALIDRMGEHMGRSPKAMRQMADSEIDMLGKAEWPELWEAPLTEHNPTSLWWINHRYVANPVSIRRTKKVFEDFRGLLGVEVHNPVRDMGKFTFPNPAAGCAKAAGFDLQESLDILSHTDVDVRCDVEAVENQIMAMIPAVREALGPASVLFTDTDIDQAVVQPGDALAAPPRFLEKLGDAEVVSLVRRHIEKTKPGLISVTTDADLLSAARNPGQPLMASRMCQLQVLYRDVRLNIEDSLCFNAATLGRDRVTANFWPSQWLPATGERYQSTGSKPLLETRAEEWSPAAGKRRQCIQAIREDAGAES